MERRSTIAGRPVLVIGTAYAAQWTRVVAYHPVSDTHSIMIAERDRPGRYGAYDVLSVYGPRKQYVAHLATGRDEREARSIANRKWTERRPTPVA